MIKITHYPVLVIGEDPHTLLAPYCEELEEPEWQDVPEESARKMAARHYLSRGTTPQSYDGVATFIPHDDEKPEPDEAQINDFASRLELGEVVAILSQHEGDQVRLHEGKVQELSQFNQECGKWDWYVIGGRWSGYFQVHRDADPMDVDYRATQDPALAPATRSVQYADRLRRRAWDDEGQLQEVRDEAIKLWEHYRMVLGNAGLGLSDVPEPPARDALREDVKEWWSHPVLEALREAELLPLFCLPEEAVRPLRMERGPFADTRAALSIVPYALLDEDGWYAPGEMGWFGMSTDSVEDREAFTRERLDWMRGQPGDTVFTLVDCHI